MKTTILLFVILVAQSLADECHGGKHMVLTNGLSMKCRKGVWKPIEKKSLLTSKPCVDNSDLSANGTCSAERGHCKQFTQKGSEMDRNCPGTCESCDSCRCQDAHQWHTYCSYWSNYCASPGVLGTWMTANCRKTCGKCKCSCCSYQGRQHALGARILLPDQCAYLECQQSLIASPSPLLPGAANHEVSHPEELTLVLVSVHDGAECCVLPQDARITNGTVIKNGSMVQEGWTGYVFTPEGSVKASCCHGSLGVALADIEDSKLPPAKEKSSTSTSTTQQPSTTSTTTSTTKPTTTTSTCPEINTDFHGNDLGIINNIPSWEDCVCECKKRKGCTGITWTPVGFHHNTYSYSRCLFKSSDAGRHHIYKGAFSANIECVNQC